MRDPELNGTTRRHALARAGSSRQGGPVLVVAPSWVGDAILSEPLIASIAASDASIAIDVLAPAWCAPVYARMRGVRRIFDSMLRHGELGFARRRSLARALEDEQYAQAIILPNSWKSALVPWLAGIPLRTGYTGEARFGIVNDRRRVDRERMPRLVDRYSALATSNPSARVPTPPVLIPVAANREAAVVTLGLATERPIAVLCPGAEFGSSKRWPPEHFALLAQKFLADGLDVWMLGSPNDKPAAAAVLAAAGNESAAIHDLTGRTDLGTAIDLLSLATVVVSNDSGLMHAAAAVRAPLVALFGSSSPVYTPPLSDTAMIARIDIACSPCFRRECPLKHFKCMRELAPDSVYDLARASLPWHGNSANRSPYS